MNILLIFFALPIATIILAAVLEKILDCPIAVAAVFFAIFLVVTFAAFDVNFLIATIVYTILAFITALIVRFIKRCREEECEECDNDSKGCSCRDDCDQSTANSGTQNSNNCSCRRRRR